ncbi:hypothetical protein [Marinoscillum sp. MHG1-6]|uniref:hypothetical protein n=1 Tax=Marinoscillum sp. MHG1-6 TaxID=2959627 RepID=UPI002157D32E|nr:hypothetical protein [Marinoscillum sp. MHG1-6]
MIVSKPKRNTAFALAVFLIVIFAVFFMLLDSLLSSADYFIIKLILTPIVLVIGLLVMGKFLSSLKRVSLGDGKIEVLFLVTRMRTVIPVKEVMGWREEVVNTKNGDFREVKILYDKKKILKLSNRENTEYDKVVKYLKQKVKIKN